MTKQDWVRQRQFRPRRICIIFLCLMSLSTYTYTHTQSEETLKISEGFYGIEHRTFSENLLQRTLKLLPAFKPNHSSFESTDNQPANTLSEAQPPTCASKTTICHFVYQRRTQSTSRTLRPLLDQDRTHLPLPPSTCQTHTRVKSKLTPLFSPSSFVPFLPCKSILSAILTTQDKTTPSSPLLAQRHPN